MSLALRAVDLERLDRALTTILSPLAHEHCDDWRSRVESSVAELLDGDRAPLPYHPQSANLPNDQQGHLT